MKFKHSIDEPNETNPFANCKLGREQYAKTLTQIISNSLEGFVLAVNNEWGTGKTTFIKMWQQYLIKEKFQTLYFNAWENDFDSNSLVAILSELKLLTGENHVAFKKVLTKGIALTKNVIPILLKALAEKYIKTEVITDAIEKLSEGALDILNEEVKEYSEKKETLKEFKSELSKYIFDNAHGKPVVFFIDELDRCKPSYAVEVLEQIKHFFSVDGIVFVLSIDKIQLGNSIKGYYGSNEIDTEGYLARFIDLEFRLPEPSYKEWIDYLYNFYGFANFFDLEVRRRHSEIQYDGDNFKKIATIICTDKQLPLRKIEKLFATTRVSLLQFHKDRYTFSIILFLFVYIRQADSRLYNQVRSRSIAPHELIKEIEVSVLKSILDDKKFKISYLIGLTLHLYNNYYKEANQEYNLYNYDSISFSISFSHFNNDLLKIMEGFRHTNYDSMGIDYLLKKIDFTDNIVN